MSIEIFHLMDDFLQNHIVEIQGRGIDRIYVHRSYRTWTLVGKVWNAGAFNLASKLCKKALSLTNNECIVHYMDNYKGNKNFFLNWVRDPLILPVEYRDK